MNNPFAMIKPAEYVSERKQIPLDTILQVAQKKEADYLKNQDYADQLQIMANNIKVRSVDNPIKQNIVNKINAVINNIASGKSGWENSGLVLKQLAKDVATNQELMSAREMYQLQQNDEKFKREALRKGIPILDFGANELPALDAAGNEQSYKPRYQIQKNWNGSMINLWKNFVKNELYGGKLPEDVSPDAPLVELIRRSGISQEQINNKLGNVINAYSNTPEFAQQIAYYKSQGLTQDEAEQTVREQIKQVGEGMIQENYDYKYLSNPKYIMKQKALLQASKEASKEKKRTFSVNPGNTIQKNISINRDLMYNSKEIKTPVTHSDYRKREEAIMDYATLRNDFKNKYPKQYGALLKIQKMVENLPEDAKKIALQNLDIASFFYPTKYTKPKSEIKDKNYLNVMLGLSNVSMQNTFLHGKTINGKHYTIKELNKLYKTLEPVIDYYKNNVKPALKTFDNYSSKGVQKTYKLVTPTEKYYNKAQQDFKNIFDGNNYDYTSLSDGGDKIIESLSKEFDRNKLHFNGIAIIDKSGTPAIEFEYLGHKLLATPKGRPQENDLISVLADNAPPEYRELLKYGRNITAGTPYKNHRVDINPENGNFVTDISFMDFLNKAGENMDVNSLTNFFTRLGNYSNLFDSKYTPEDLKKFLRYSFTHNNNDISEDLINRSYRKLQSLIQAPGKASVGKLIDYYNLN